MRDGRTPAGNLAESPQEGSWRRRIRAYRRAMHAGYLKRILSTELWIRKARISSAINVSRFSATLLSIVVTLLFWFFADAEAKDIKASETHLAAAQIIGAALALVLSLSIIPAQRAAELFSFTVLKLFAKDRILISVFLVLVATTLLSLLLGTRWANSLDAKTSLAIQFILLGISFDALRQFYVSTLGLLAPESAIQKLVQDTQAHIRSMRRVADKVVAIQIASVGGVSRADELLHAQMIVGTNLPRRLQSAASELEEYAHRFIARRDASAALQIVAALETLASDYSDVREKGVTLHLDPKFLISGPQSDISDVLNPIYDSVHRIIEGAIAAKNERVVQHAISSMGRMVVRAMSLVAIDGSGQKIAPLAYGACFFFDRAVRTVLTTDMTDATLHAITSLASILSNRSADAEMTGLTEQANDCLFAIAADGYRKAGQVTVFRAVEVMLHSLKFEIDKDNFDAESLRSTLGRITQIIPLEVLADASGSRVTQTFPAYNLGFEASIPMLVQSVAQNVRVDPERPWNDPFSELSEVAEIVRDHYRRLTSDIDFKGTLLAKWIMDSLDAVLRVLFHEITNPPKDAEEFVETVLDDLKPLITWMSGFFPENSPAKKHHLSDATAHLTVLGISALDENRPDVARTCAGTLKKIAHNVGMTVSAHDLADIHVDLEVLARAGDVIGAAKFSADVRAMITQPPNLTPENERYHIEARERRFNQLDEALAGAGRRRYKIGTDPIELLFAFKQKHSTNKTAS
jgi:hypothetical protein